MKAKQGNSWGWGKGLDMLLWSICHFGFGLGAWESILVGSLIGGDHRLGRFDP